MNIIHTVASLENRAAGPTYSVTGLARAQARHGAQVAIFSVGENSAGTTEPYEDRRFRNSLAAVPMLSKLGVSIKMANEMERRAPDIVETHGLWLLPNTYRTKSSAFVVTPRGMLTDVALSFSPHKKAIVRRLFQDRSLATAAMFHATAESEFDDIRRFGLKQPVAVIPNGIDVPNITANRVASPHFTVLSLGRIHPKKGLDTLIQAWASIEGDFPGSVLRIVGPDEGGYASELRGMIRTLELTSIMIEPPVFGQDKTDLMARADLFVLPSRSENFGMTVAESLAVGVPVIATKGAPWEGLQAHRCGWWIDHGSTPLSACLRSALALTDVERRAMGERGRKWMSRDFSWERIGQMSLDAYSWLLGRGDRPDFVYEA